MNASTTVDTEWFERLLTKIKEDGRSPRAISLAAGLGPNYVEQMLKRGTRPNSRNVVKLAGALGISLTYLTAGAEMAPQDEEFLRLALSLSPEKKQALLVMLRGMQEPEGS